jgi:C_GCAxxG_C_C family probable redox protein
MTPEEMQERAVQLMMKRFHCSQAVLAAGQEKLGRPDDELVRAMGAFGGGLGGGGEVCGAVVGAIGLLGLVFSRGREDELEDARMWNFTREFLRRFREEITQDQGGGINCRDIAQVDWTDRAQVKAFYMGEKSRHCMAMVGETARLIGEMIDGLKVR